MNAVLTVLLKEIRDNLRDRRTLINALITGPLIGPLVFVAILSLVITHQMDKAEQPLKVPVIGAAHAPHLIAALKQEGLSPQPAVADPAAAVRQRRSDVVMRIPARYGQAWRAGKTAQVELFYDSSHNDSALSAKRLKSMLRRYAQRQGALRGRARGLSPSIVMPLAVDARDQSTPQSRAGQLFAIMPYFFVLTVFVGGMYLAIDLSAVERERQSLEPLFANPVRRGHLLAGKLGAICAFSLSSLLISVTAVAVAGHWMPTEKLGMSLHMGAAFAAQVLVLMLPLVILLAVLQTLVAAFAKSYREAQTYLGILMVVPALPSVLLSMLPVHAADWMYAVPLLSQQVGIMELLRGGQPTTLQVGLSLVSGILVAWLAGLVTLRVYASERLAISA